MKTIAVFGGTFNPIHIGHIEMLSAVCKLSYVDEVLVVPTKIPPHKTVGFLASDEDRVNMLQLACKPFKKVKVCDIELKREGKSYTFETLTELKKQYSDAKFILCIGGDMLTTFTSWYNYSEILKMASILVFKRVGDDISDFDNAVLSLCLEGAEISVIDDEITEVSSTFIRENAHKPNVICDLLDDAVFDYITKNKIYEAKTDV